ncbi:MAG: DUF721 domain-containing protein [Candidatus Cloacimonetes bacterium]|nr:DUF721 domain-containing protein [Candidatus Cloacimonadota bacterium]
MSSWKALDQFTSKLVYRIASDKYRSFVFVYLNWEKVVGGLLAEKSYPIKFEKNVLYVAVANSSWMQELILMKMSIIRKYEVEHSTKIRDIVFLIRS